MHPSRKQSQPPAYFALQRSWSAALLVPAPPQRFPISNHCHISPISFGNCAGNLVYHRSEKNPLATFGATFLERQKLKNFGQILKNASFGHNQAKFGQFCILGGCGLPNSAAILRRPVPHVGFCLEKSICWHRKIKKGRFLQKGRFLAEQFT